MAVAELAADRRCAPATVDVYGFDVRELLVVPDPPTPGDPDTDPGDPTTVWAVPRRGRDVQLLVQRTVTHEPIGTLRTAVVEEWDEDVDEVPRARADASSWDPLWAAMGGTSADYRGRTVYRPDLKGIEFLIGCDGEPAWTGIVRQPVDIGDDRVPLPMRGPEILFTERHLGRVEQYDHLEGWGDFEAYSVGTTPPGLVLDPNPGQTISAEVVYDSVRGVKCLEVTGWGWVESPKVPLAGQAAVGRTAEGSAFAKLHDSVPMGAPLVQTLCQRIGASAPANLPSTVVKQGERTSESNDWTDDPVSSGCTMERTTALHNVWVRLAGYGSTPVRYDLVRLQQGVQSGSLTEQPYSWYADLFLRDAQDEGLGGASWGIRTQIDSASTGQAQLQISHNTQPLIAEVLSQVTDVEGGCEVWVDPSWTARIMARRGQVRNDVAFTPATVLACRWAPDPGAEIDDLIVDTGRGRATSLVTSTVSSARISGRHRITKVVRVPSTWSLKRTDVWARQQAGPAMLPHMTAQLDVPWSYGVKVACGDSLLCALVDGNVMDVGVRRVMNKRYRPLEGIMTFTVGNAS